LLFGIAVLANHAVALQQHMVGVVSHHALNVLVDAAVEFALLHG
jgi:hypothetical protein